MAYGNLVVIATAKKFIEVWATESFPIPNFEKKNCFFIITDAHFNTDNYMNI
jgi:hypothetical protein